MRVFRLSRIRDKVSYATKAEHDFTPPEDFDPWVRHPRRLAARRPGGHRAVWISERIAWLIERDFGARPSSSGPAQWRADRRARTGVVFTTEYAHSRAADRPGCSGWASTRACSSPPELVDEARRAPRR